jgi:isoquinoline 1-oxidoreductase beta subunit
MNMATISREGFIRLTGAAGAGLALGIHSTAATATAATAPIGASDEMFAPNIWVRIAPTDVVTVIVSKSEMGQGVVVGLPAIIAEELDANVERIQFEFAPADPRYNDAEFREIVTGGSTSIANLWNPLRQAGAAARAMLVSAAAAAWGVDPSTCRTSAGVVYHDASGRRATYGSLASAAASVPVPANVPLKIPASYSVIGKARPRQDIPQKVAGKATFGIDVRLPGMRYAAIARSPVFDGHVRSFDARKAKAVRGVIDVVQISNGVAVIATNTWAAFQGKQALNVVWDSGAKASINTPALFAEAEHLAKTHADEHIAISRGTPDMTGENVLEAIYRGPFLAHATMEPMNATALVRDGKCEVWAPTQVQSRSLAAAVAASGLPAARCSVHTTFLGGGFGRRLEADYVGEAVEVSKAIRAPVKVTWTREDDIQHDFYRPMSVNVVRGVLSSQQLVALSHQVVSGSWLRRWAPPLVKSGIDDLDLTEVNDAPYYVDNFRVSYIDHENGIPFGSWRAPDANWNGFVTESFIDELAHAAGVDPLTFRLGLLQKTPRAANALSVAAKAAGWPRKRPGIAQGLAVTAWAGSFVGMVADVSMVGKMPKVHRVVAAVDCGIVVSPDIVVQQSQGATNFGLSAALTGKITIAGGRVEQNNFYDYTILRMQDAPVIEVHVIPSLEKPTGVGELCTPPIAPAVGNAIFALTGRRTRQLPFSDALA